MRRLLFVDDEPLILDALRRMMHRWREEWDMRFALGGAAALQSLDEAPFDVVLTDMRMPGMDGAQLLGEVAARHPATIRIVLTGQTDEAAALRALPVAHQFLMKPCDPATLRQVIVRTLALRDRLADPALRSLAGQVDSLPSVPTTYLALGVALGKTDSSITDIAAIIERDPALAAKVLQLVNSSFFGQRREISSVRQACILLGTGLIRNLALAHEAFAAKAWRETPGLSLQEEGDHAVAVARIACAMQVTAADAEAAVAAGLLHDIGKLVIASRTQSSLLLDQHPIEVEGQPCHEVEIARYGVSHAEVGAYLLGLWGLPHLVVEAVAFHHTPSLVREGDRRVLAAVHVADTLVHEAAGTPWVVPLDSECVELLGGAVELDRWRVQLAERP
jgi:putative nucleotidyltransferase with HDIG domain